MEQNYVTSAGSTETAKLQLPTETVELPSKGYLYPEENPLSQGKLEIKYMLNHKHPRKRKKSFLII
jgi:hypothetical protein